MTLEAGEYVKNRYHRSVFLDAEDSSHTFKVVVMGPVLAGKTSLIARYVYGEFSKASRATVGSK